MKALATTAGVVLLLACAVLAFKARKRRFDRTNEAGVERFSSYGQKLRSKAWDAFLGGASIAFGIAGILILAYQYQDSWGWIVLLPALLIALFFAI